MYSAVEIDRERRHTIRGQACTSSHNVFTCETSLQQTSLKCRDKGRVLNSGVLWYISHVAGMHGFLIKGDVLISGVSL